MDNHLNENTKESGDNIKALGLSLPKGGGAISGMGETCTSNPFTGTLRFSLPLPTTPCRDFTPQMNLSYDSAGGNGVFGIGFSVDIPAITRKVSMGVAKYDESDIFLFAQAEELVKKAQASREVIDPNGTEWEVTLYELRTEGLFSIFEYWKSSASSYWRVISKDNITSVYGQDPGCRIYDPQNPNKVFSWLIQSSQNAAGSKMEYEYKQENKSNVRDALFMQGRCFEANKYISSIKYGNYYSDNGQEKMAFEIIFDYGEYDISAETLKKPGCKPYQPLREWPCRQDSFSSYRSGFEIRTCRLCHNILLFHCFEKELGEEPALIKALNLSYREPSQADPAMMSQIAMIGINGYRRQTNESYDIRQLPSLGLTYTDFTPVAQAFSEIRTKDTSTAQGNIDLNNYILVDLYGDGIPGFLQSDAKAALYYRALGNGVYTMQNPENFPLEKDLAGGQALLAGLDGNGLMDLMICRPQRGGYYKSNPDGSWMGYQDFEAYPAELLQPQSEWVDLSGRGLNDLFIDEGDFAWIYPSLKHKGFGNPIYVDLPEGFPLADKRDQEELVGFADVIGDGLAHRVRIHNGSVECWPNLGHGRFGERILLSGSLKLNDVQDISRFQFADINGNGVMDLIYMYPDHFDIFFNCSGNYFSEPVGIMLPQMYQTIDRICFGDVDGSGCSSLIFSKMEEQIKHYYYNFAGGCKPYLLKRIENNMGAETNISFKSSVSYYLEDQAGGRGWNTTLPFPVQVVDRIETADLVSNVKFVQKYRYHDGYYDYTEREFRGFGYVEIQDAEDYQPSVGRDQDNLPLRRQEEIKAAPILTKRWYHTGAVPQFGTLSRHYAKEYYQGDPQAYAMPDSTLDDAIAYGEAESFRLACRTLSGQLLREEVYAQDGLQELSQIPYTVNEHNYYVRQLQPAIAGQPGIYYLCGREAISYQYERNPSDPRIKHEFTLETDRYGNVRRMCGVYYPRRNGVTPEGTYDSSEQYLLRGMVVLSDFAVCNDQGNRCDILCEAKEYDLLGLTLNDNLYFSYDEIKRQIEQVLLNLIPYGAEPDRKLLSAQLLSWQRQLYWDDAQQNSLTLGQVTSRALLHHTEQAEFGDDLIRKTLGERLTEGILDQDCGFIRQEDYWWNCGPVNYYYKQEDHKQHQLYMIENSWAGEEGETYQRAVYQYDAYAMAPVSFTRMLSDTKSMEQSALLDYHVMTPYQITDENDNISQVLFDPLGMVIAATRYGTLLGQIVGGKDIDSYQPIAYDETSFEDVINHHEKYLQGMNFYYYYDFSAWPKRRQPTCCVSLQRDVYPSDISAGQQGHVMLQISYQNGSGQEAEKKVKAAKGMALRCDDAGNPIFDDNHRAVWEDTDPCYITSGRTVYNNKGKPVRQYLTYYTSTAQYENQEDMERIGSISVMIHYDPLMRQIRCDKPKGFFTKVEFTPWLAQYYDENDTIKDSAFFKEFMASYPSDPTEREQDEKNALEKAGLCHNTMLTKVFDNTGEVYLEINRDDKNVSYTTRKWLDAKGNIIGQSDPRLYELDQQEGTIHYSVRYVLDMDGKPLQISSADAGTSYSLRNMYGHEAHTWTARNFHKRIGYDRLQRVIAVKVDGDDGKGLALNQTVERIRYGEAYSDNMAEAKDRNLIGRIYQHLDQAGELIYEDYSLTGQPLHRNRRFNTDYKQEVNWDTFDEKLLEEEAYLSGYVYDAFDRLREETMSSGGKVRVEYNQTGLPEQMLLEDGEKLQQIIADIRYNAVGQREQVLYGNGVACQYTYESTTLRLLELKAARPQAEGQEGTILQQLAYTYDPVGNVTRLRDYSEDTLITNGQIVKPVNDYTYNPLYRLTKAAGRQHPGVAPGRQDPWMQSSPLPHPNDMAKLEAYLQQYTYDLAGNLLATKHQAPSGDWLRTHEIESGSNRTTTITLSGQAYKTEYDAGGNLLGLSDDDHMHWNDRNNLSGVDIILREENISDRDYYVYDSSGQRVRKVSERLTGQGVSEVEETLYIGSYEKKRVYKRGAQADTCLLDRDAIAVMDGQVRVAIAYHWLIDSTQRETDATDLRIMRYQLGNGMGSAVIELDQQARLITYEEYYPYGGTSILAGRSKKEVMLKAYRYCTKERDASTGLYYYGARYYPPWLGRWISPDPSGTGDGLNLYIFVGNNPISLVDDTGNIGLGWLGKLVGGAVTAVVGAVMGLCGTTGTQNGPMTSEIATIAGMAVSTYMEGGSMEDELPRMMVAGMVVSGVSYLSGLVSKYAMKYFMDHADTRSVANKGAIIAGGLGILGMSALAYEGISPLNVPSMLGAIGGSVLVSGAHLGMVRTGGAVIGNLPVEVSPNEFINDPGWFVQGAIPGLANRTYLELNNTELFADLPDIVNNPSVIDHGVIVNCDVVVVHGFPGLAFPDDPTGSHHQYMNKEEIATALRGLGYPHVDPATGNNIPIKFISCFGAFGGQFFSTAQTIANVLNTDVYGAYFPVTIDAQNVWHRYSRH